MTFTEFVSELDRELETFGINTNGTPEAVLAATLEEVRESWSRKSRADEAEGRIEGLELEAKESDIGIIRLNEENDNLSDRIEELTQELEALKAEREAA